MYIENKKNKLNTTQNTGTTFEVYMWAKCGKENNLRILDTGIRESEETTACHFIWWKRIWNFPCNNVFFKNSFICKLIVTIVTFVAGWQCKEILFTMW